MNISVIGTGYVGLVTGTCFADYGVNVICVDKDEDRIARLEKGDVPFYEPGLTELVHKGMRAERLTFTTDLAAALNRSLVVFIAVGTPAAPDGRADLRYIDEVADQIGRHLDGYKVIVTKSTVPVGTGRRIQRTIAAQAPAVRFDVASNPEFLREGSAIEDFMRPNRVVVGTDTCHATAILHDLYRPVIGDMPFIATDLATSELIKYASNAFLATKISFINELSQLCEELHANVQTVARGMGLDRRIGPDFLHAGPGYGGSCFPKDVLALIATARDANCSMRIAEAAAEANTRQHTRMREKILTAAGGGLQGKRVGLLGLTFKPDTNDLRESPALALARWLLEEGADLCAYDPAGMDEAGRLLMDLQFGADAYAVAEDADLLVLGTEWNQFRNLDLSRLHGSMRSPVFVDLRNVYDPSRMADAGFTYWSVGRSQAGACVTT